MLRVAVVAQTSGTANGPEQKRLGLAGSDRVIRVQRTRSDDHRMLAYELIVLVLRAFPGLTVERDITADVVELARDHGVVLGRVIERIELVRASAHVARQLGMRAQSQVLRLDRVTRTPEGMPVEWRLTFAVPT